MFRFLSTLVFLPVVTVSIIYLALTDDSATSDDTTTPKLSTTPETTKATTRKRIQIINKEKEVPKEVPKKEIKYHSEVVNALMRSPEWGFHAAITPLKTNTCKKTLEGDTTKINNEEYWGHTCTKTKQKSM